jgi:hypothetical protein
MSALEDGYRRVLRLLPAAYRADREEEMVAAFLDSAGRSDDAHSQEEDLRRPSWPEIGSVVALAVRVRLGGAGAGPRSVAWGQTVRLVALLGLAFQAAMSWVYFGGLMRIYGLIGAPLVDIEQVAGPAGSGERLWHLAQNLAGGLWVAAFVTLVGGRTPAAKALAVLALACEVGDAAVSVIGPDWWQLLQARAPLIVLSAVSVLALCAGFHRDAPPVRRTRWLGPLPLGAGLLVSVALGVTAMQLTFHPWSWALLDAPGLVSALIVITGVAYIGVHGHVPARQTPSWPLALTILAIPVLYARLPSIDIGSRDAATHTMTAISLGQCIAVLLVGLVLFPLGLKKLRAIAASAP